MRAASKFIEFHQRDVRRVGEFHADLAIPDTLLRIGDATQVLYRSDKLNPTTGEDEGWVDYFHDHHPGVVLYRPAGRGVAGLERTVPEWLRDVRELTWLGYCLGLSYRDDGGRVVDVAAAKPLPELYCTPTGRALLVVQGKRKLVACMWGGRLGVEDRGIVH